MTISAAGQLVYAVGDVHGCHAQLRDLLGLITADARARAGHRCPVLIFLGDYVDRGPATAAVIEAMVWLSRHGPMVTRFLKGNHEQMMLDWIANPLANAAWLKVGGEETLRSYHVTPPGPDGAGNDGLRARDDLLEQMPVAHLRFLQVLESMVAVGDYLFVHAGIRPGVALAKQAASDLLWIRDLFLESALDHGRTVVHGHSWIDDQPQVRRNRIGIATGVYETGVLTAVRIEDGGFSFLAATA